MRYTLVFYTQISNIIKSSFKKKNYNFFIIYLMNEQDSYHKVQYHFKQKVFIYNFVTILNFFVIKKKKKNKREVFDNLNL